MQSCFCFSIFLFAKHTKRQSDARDVPTDKTLNAPCAPQILLFLIKLPFPQIKKSKGTGKNIVEGTVVKAEIGESEEEVRAGNSRRKRKELNGVVQRVSGRMRFLERFQNGREKNM